MEALVKLLEGAEDAYVAKGALGCISALVNSNPVNKQAVREANGVQGLVKLLASNPADKDVLRMTAQALKQMTAERSVPFLPPPSSLPQSLGNVAKCAWGELARGSGVCGCGKGIRQSRQCHLSFVL